MPGPSSFTVTKGVAGFTNSQTSGSYSTLWGDCPILDWITDPSIGVYFFDDFLGYHTTHLWTSTLTDTGTTAITTGLGGWLSIVPSDGSVADNDESYAYGTSAAFQVQAGKDLWYECEVSFAEANTDDINVIAGLSSVGTDDLLVSNGGGPSANFDGLAFYKVDGGTTWNAIATQAANQTLLTALATRVAGTPVRLGIRTYSNNLATFFLNGAQITSTGTYLPTAAMRPVFGVKNGAANNENLTVNWVRCFQIR
jgi:hypothetical protein